VVEGAVSIVAVSDVKSPRSTSSSGIDCHVPTLRSVYNAIVEETRTNSAQCGGTAAVRSYGTVVKSLLYTT